MSNKRKIRKPRTKKPKTLAERSQEVTDKVRRQVEHNHPDLYPLHWGAYIEEDGSWWVEGVTIPRDLEVRYTEKQVRDVVTEYAQALNGSEPYERVWTNEAGRFREIETNTEVAGVKVTIWGVLEDPGGTTLQSPPPRP